MINVNIFYCKQKEEILPERQRSALAYKNNRTRISRITKGRRVSRKRNTSISTSASYLRKSNMEDSPNKIIESKTAISPSRKQTFYATSPAPSSKFSPKTPSPIKQALDKSPRNINMSQRKLFSDKMEELMPVAIRNLNMAKEGAIVDNNIDLEKVYSSREFNYKYNNIDTTSMKYEMSDIVVPIGTYSRYFFLIVASVFSKPFNCGYFDKDELDLIFSLLTISRNAQELLIRMLKRKQTWHRVDSIKYDDISINLKPIFDELVSRCIFKNNTEKEDLVVLLKLMQVGEIRKFCKEYKINASGKKENYIQSVMNFHNKTKPLFPGMPSPSTKLRASVNKVLGYCILVNTKVNEIVNRIISLLVPNQDPQNTITDLFLIILKEEMKEIKFPEVTIREFPIFASKGHLLRYVTIPIIMSFFCD